MPATRKLILIVIDGLTLEAVERATAEGLRAGVKSSHGLVAATAGNYGGKLGPYHIRLHDVLLSILIERTGQISDEGELVSIGFLFPALAEPHLYPGAGWTVMEGPRAVAELTIKAVLIKAPY